jgi:hypothetical protein
MNILKGTFRLSIVDAIMAAFWSAHARHKESMEWLEWQVGWVNTVKCGARVGEAELRSSKNEHGLYDLSKVGCSPERFLTSNLELTQVANGTIDYGKHTWGNDIWPPKSNPAEDAFQAGKAFALVNLLGLAAVVLRSVALWVIAGFRQGA